MFRVLGAIFPALAARFMYTFLPPPRSGHIEHTAHRAIKIRFTTGAALGFVRGFVRGFDRGFVRGFVRTGALPPLLGW